MTDSRKKKPVIAFTVADKNNIEDAKLMEKSLRAFHSEKELPLKIYTEESIGDRINFYRQKPFFMRHLIEDYELVIGLDADQLIVGNLDYILKTPYEVGTVLNWNPHDEPIYGPITVFDIPPRMYFNCGLVATRSKKFVQHWWNLCNSYHFQTLKYKEQDILNVIVHYGTYETLCFDFYDKVRDYRAWHGLAAKGNWNRAVLRDKDIIIPKDIDKKYPEEDTVLKVIHFAGGQESPKMNYRIYFNEDVIEFIDKILNGKEKGKKTTKKKA